MQLIYICSSRKSKNMTNNNKREDILNKVPVWNPITKIGIGMLITSFIILPAGILACWFVFSETKDYYPFIIISLMILFFLCMISVGGYLTGKGITVASERAERKQELEIVKIKQEEKKKPESKMQEEKRQPEGKAMEIEGEGFMPETKKKESKKVSWGQKARIIFLVICIISVIVIPVAWNQISPIEKPLPLDYGMSWVILALISMVTLAYVQFTNRLRDILIKGKKDVLETKAAFNKTEASWEKILLSWTGLILFITILTLTIRIVLLSFDPCMNFTKQAIIYSDYFLISSFIIGFLMRFWLYLEAHKKDFGHYLKEYYYGRV